MTCPNCGMECEENTLVCELCGYEFQQNYKESSITGSNMKDNVSFQQTSSDILTETKKPRKFNVIVIIPVIIILAVLGFIN